MGKIGRNEPCPCGSGKKYKKCCLGRQPTPAPSPPAPREEASFVFGNTSDKEILARLHWLGFRCTRQTIELLARDSLSAADVVESLDESSGPSDRDKLTAQAAIDELWRRWLPDRPSAETLAQQIDETYDLLDRNGFRGLERWIQLWDVIAARMTPRMDTADKIEDQILDGSIDLLEWLENLLDELDHRTRIRPTEQTRRGAQLGQQALEQLRGETPAALARIRMATGLLLALSGRRDEAKSLLLQMIEDSPDLPEGYLGLAHVLSRDGTWSPPEDLDRAIAAVEQGIAQCPKQEHEEDTELDEMLEKLRAARDQARKVSQMLATARDPREIVDLLHRAGQSLHARLKQAILELGQPAVPHLLAIVDDEDTWDSDAPGEGYAPVHAADLLGQLQAVEAIGPMLRVLAQLEENSCILHDRIPLALPRIGPPVLEPALEAYRATADASHRNTLCYVLSSLGVRDERVFELLMEQLARDPCAGAGTLADYGDPRALDSLHRELAEVQVEPGHFPQDQVIVELLEAIERLDGKLTPAELALEDRLLRGRRQVFGFDS